VEILTISLLANETKPFDKVGRYLEILDSAGAVSIWLYDRNGGRVDDMLAVQSGIFMDGTDFSRFEVFSPTAQTIRLMITDRRGGSRRQPGNVAIVDAITGQALAAQQVLTINASVLVAHAVVVDQALAPAGIVVKSVSLLTPDVGIGASGQEEVFVYASPAAQDFAGTSVPGVILAHITAVGSVASPPVLGAQINRRLPPGWSIRLSAAANGLQTTNTVRARVTWEPVA
jgi:hypothetical protein